MKTQNKGNHFLGISGICFALVTAGVVMQVSEVASAPEEKAAEPVAPTGAVLAKSFTFSKPVNFKVEPIPNTVESLPVVTMNPVTGVAEITIKKKTDTIPKKDAPIWAYAYSAEKQSLLFYKVELYKARTFMGSRRESTEKSIEEREKKSESHTGILPEKLTRFSGTDVRPDGRKVYFSVVGFGPGGAITVIFTTIGKYDFVLSQITDFEDDMPQAKKIKNPAMPTVELTEGFKRLEEAIPHLIEKP